MNSIYPALINIRVFSSGTSVYNENMLFRTEPDEIDAGIWFNFIRPDIKHDHIMLEYLRPLKESEK